MVAENWPPLKHVWTQAFIGLCLVLMIIILIDLSRKFYYNAQPANAPKHVKTASTTNSMQSPRSYTSSASPRKPKKKPIAKFYRITAITSVATFTCAVLIDFGNGVYYFDSGIDVFHTKDYWSSVLTNIFFGISTISLYIFMFGRLYLTFKESESKYHLSKLTIYIVTTLIILNAFAIIFYTICIGMIYDYIAIGTFYKYLDASFQFILICDFTLNAIILALFLYKLQQIILSLDFASDYNHVDIRNANEDQVDDENDNGRNRKQSVKLNDHQIKMITIMTRHTILSGIAIFFNVIFYISIIHGSNFDKLNEADLWFLAYSNLIKAIHGLSVAITLYLNFSFNINLYFRCCNKCHLCCFNMFTKFAKDRIRKKNENDTMELAIEPINNDGDDDRTNTHTN